MGKSRLNFFTVTSYNFTISKLNCRIKKEVFYTRKRLLLNKKARNKICIKAIDAQDAEDLLGISQSIKIGSATTAGFIHMCNKSPCQFPTTTPPPRDDSSKTIVWIILILVILFFVLPIILGFLMVIFLSPIGFPEDTIPTGIMHFERDPEEPGLYTGNFISLDDRISLNDMSISITDDDLDSSASLNPLVDDGFVEIPNGMNLTFTDVNNNERIDTVDTFIINNGAPDDRIMVIHRPTGGLIASYTLS